MTQFSKTAKNTKLELRMRCGGSIVVDKDGRHAVDPTQTAAIEKLIAESNDGDRMEPCSYWVTVPFGKRGRLQMAALQGHLQDNGWMLSTLAANIEGVQINDPLCPLHGLLLARALLRQPTCTPAAAQALQGFIERAEAVIEAAQTMGETD